MEGLFAFFFSNYRTTFNEEDCRFFLELANQQDSFCLPSAHVRRVSKSVADALHSCASMSIFKLYLSRILGESQHEILLRDPQVS